METITKSQLVAAIAQRLQHLPSLPVDDSINLIIQLMGDALAAGEVIEIRGFGRFATHYQPPYQAHNPKTGELLITQGKYKLHFKPGKPLRQRVNGTDDN